MIVGTWQQAINSAGVWIEFAGLISVSAQAWVMKRSIHSIGKKKSAYKPGSVESSHSSGLQVTLQLKQSTREPRGPRVCSPI